MSDELIDICNENDVLLGIQKLKSIAHRDGLWHRSVHIWIYNSKGEIIIQLRAKDKPLYPNMWDISVAGHVSANEEPIISAVREISEEIGLKANEEDIKFFKTRKHNSIFKKIVNNEIQYVYFMKYDGNISKLKLQTEEVQKIKFISFDELKKELKENQNKYVFHEKYLNEIFKEINKKLGK